MKNILYFIIPTLVITIMLLVNHYSNRAALIEQLKMENERKEYFHKMLEQATEEYSKYQKLAYDCFAKGDMDGYRLYEISARKYRTECLTYLAML